MTNTRKQLDFYTKPAIVNFGDVFNDLKNYSQTPKKQNPILEKIGLEITKLANLPNKAYEDPKLRFKYQNNLCQLCQPLVAKYKTCADRETLNVVIERGAILVNAFFPINKDNLLRVTGKRIKKKTCLGVRFSNFSLPKDLKKFKTLSIQEDCIATGDTITGLLIILNRKGFKFKKIIVNCPVATRQGAEFLLKKFPDLQLNISLYAYRLNKDFYIMRDEKKYFVGDMGEWSKILPKEFDQKAIWNKNRLDY